MALSDEVSLHAFASVSSVQGFTSSVATTRHAAAKFLHAQGNPPDYETAEIRCAGLDGKHTQILLVSNFTSNLLAKSPTGITQSNTIK